MEAVSTSETSVNFCETTRRNISEDIHLLNSLHVYKKSMTNLIMLRYLRGKRYNLCHSFATTHTHTHTHTPCLKQITASSHKGYITQPRMSKNWNQMFRVLNMLHLLVRRLECWPAEPSVLFLIIVLARKSSVFCFTAYSTNHTNDKYTNMVTARKLRICSTTWQVDWTRYTKVDQ
jgi:hypothetical protein